MRSKETYEEAKRKREEGAAANDKTEAKPVERYVIGTTDTVKRGFLKELCDFTRKKGTVDAEKLAAGFAGRRKTSEKFDWRFSHGIVCKLEARLEARLGGGIECWIGAIS